MVVFPVERTNTNQFRRFGIITSRMSVRVKETQMLYQ